MFAVGLSYIAFIMLRYVPSIHAHMDTLSLTKEARIYNGLKTISLTSGAGKTGQPLVKDETRTLSNTIHKNKLKMD